MIFDLVNDFATAVAPAGAILGLDVGTKTIGIAASDGLRLTASPIETIRRTKFTPDAARIQELASERGVVGFIIGLPVNMDGSEGPRAQSIRQFARNLHDIISLPVGLWDERLSTAAVTRTLIEADVSRKRRREVVDKLAAAYILQGALDAMQHL